MRNAAELGPIDPPTDPFASVPLPAPGNGRKAQVAGLPPGVSPDIFGANSQQDAQPGGGQGALPPVAPPPQPWPMAEQPAFGGQGPPERPPSFDPDPPRRGRLLPVIATVVVLLALLAYAVPAVMMSGSVLRGTNVGGVDIGGLTVTEAADKLRDELSAKIDKPIAVEADGRRQSVNPAESGMELDVVSTIEQAPSGFPSPVEVWRALVGSTDLEPKVTVDAAELSRAVEKLADTLDKTPREGRVYFKDGKPAYVTPREGRVLDQEAAVKAIRDAHLAPRTTLTLPMVTAEPKTTLDSVKEALAVARRALAGPIVLTNAGREVLLPVATIAAHLTFVSDGAGGLEPRFDAKEALAGVESDLIDASQAPRDAGYDVVNGRLRLVSARKGRGVDDRKLAAAVAETVASGGSRTIAVELAVVAPKVSDDEVKKLGIREKVGEFTTEHPCCVPRVTNIHRMADAVDGYLVRPGETFSINDVVGERTAAKGYVPAGQIVGDRTEDGVGGGVSQFATTMYNAAFFGGFEDVQHMAHSFYISRYPAGREATVFWPSVDLKWRNDSDYGVLVKTAYTDRTITVSLWSTKRYDKVESISSAKRAFTPFTRETSSDPKCQRMIGGQGFTVDVTRVITQGGKEIKREKKTTIYRPQKDLTCTGG
ncbi:VanW family protein [Nonomuraea sp. NPDC046570]|uniref:VanW family protein n=1 Tax=Nonomuraea sp. NPDC046570 TaxID=3155255 RepID=UPI003400C1EB